MRRPWRPSRTARHTGEAPDGNLPPSRRLNRDAVKNQGDFSMPMIQQNTLSLKWRGLAALAALAGLVGASVATGRFVTPSAPAETGPNLPAQPIGPNDLLSISVYGAPEFSRTVRVGEEGLIRLPMLRAKIAVLDLPPAKLAT